MYEEKKDYIVELENLQRLKENGILTEMEFEVEKAKILNSTHKTETQSYNTNNTEGKATAGFVLGLCSIIAWIIPIIGYPVTGLGIVFSCMGMNSKNKTYATIGLVFSIIFLIVTLINSIAGAIMMSEVMRYLY